MWQWSTLESARYAARLRRVGVRLAENTIIAEAIPAAAVNKPALFQYSSKGVLVSMELA